MSGVARLLRDRAESYSRDGGAPALDDELRKVADEVDQWQVSQSGTPYRFVPTKVNVA